MLDDNIDKPLLPAPIINKTLEDHPVYTTPILVVAGIYIMSQTREMISNRVYIRIY